MSNRMTRATVSRSVGRSLGHFDKVVLVYSYKHSAVQQVGAEM